MSRKAKVKAGIRRSKAAVDSLAGLPSGGKFFISILIDGFDFFLGRIPGLGTIWDLVQTYVAYCLWGPAGLAAIWEMVDLTDQIDGFVPSVTLAGLLSEVVGR